LNFRSEVGGHRPEGDRGVTRVLAFLMLVVQIFALLLWTLLQPEDLRAQSGLPPASGTAGVAGEIRTVTGRVLSGSSESPLPIANHIVVLHRISADSSGPVDSVNTSTNGTYRFRYKLDGPRSMYIVSSRYAGVAYFTTPLRDAAVTSPDADITVYDTTSAIFPLSVRARHVVVAPAEAGVRRVVDVLEIANDSNRTLVVGASGATWRLALPRDAREPGSSGGDLPPEAFRFAEGAAELVVPIQPGSRQVVLTYAIPARGSTSIPIADATGTLEVLVEGPTARVTGAGLTAEEPVTLEGRTFQRFTASPVSAATAFTVGAAGAGGNARRVALLAIALVAVALGIVIALRAPAPAGPSVIARSPAESLAREIAALDHVYAEPARREGTAGDYYRQRRATLFDRLVDAQAVEDRGTTT
jgi:hypothetical protein